jgi:transposase
MLRAEANAPISGCQKVLGAMGVEISTGAICNRLYTMSRALQETHEGLAARLPHETRLNIDETTLPQEGKKLWIWAFVAKNYTFFKIDPSRSTAVLEAVLGPDCRAIIGSDLFGAYTKFAKTTPVQIQLCWAHLIRDLLLIAESQNKTIGDYGKRMLGISKRIFRTWHRRTEANAKRTKRKLERLKAEFLQTGKRTQAGGLARTMRVRLTKHGGRYFTFLDHPDLEPTNNVAEQEIRQCVLSRRVTQGVRGEKGQRFWERIWTVLATLRRRNQNAFAFLSASASAYFNSQPAPNL